MVHSFEEMEEYDVYPKESTDNHLPVINYGSSSIKKNRLVRQDAFDLVEPPGSALKQQGMPEKPKEQ
uniref:Uncharacterized protein n=1 Tax=Tetranychus urticae TaxID=32264 RepID=T1K7H3_TETUR